ncbi:branched-chain amino acid transport system permease protein [Pseudoxanthobacter soli DSM 19599]|uniref:Branched-chain amino acid transport system permease protein n=1 Tax=Pseudoxanthobacter soli DSM 19599 TaxID=1123029 RepID=A0A1M7ZPE1_9HYPH|nr:branched-chain amino acid ABC transporter permease [Pseudoxanthobacter soli]SHO66689.1 branched-chain amino acid transport system permease protein [Pseudoxanthobacter soli DSM 19599]
MLDFLVFAVTTVAIWSVLGLSLNLQFGLTGLVNFGQVLPFALGAFAVAFAASHGFPVWAGLIAGALAAIAAGLLVLLPVGRLAQDYWALVTLGAGELVRLTFVNVPGLAGGVDGASVPRIADPKLAMALALALFAVALALTLLVDRSPLGRMLRVLREDPVLAATLGRRPPRLRAVVIVVSWLLAGLTGVLYAHVIGYVAPPSFTVAETFIVWTAVVLGGPGSVLGVVVGTAVVQLLSISTRFFAQWSGLPFDLVANLRLALFGLVLILMFLFRPEGLIPERKVKTNAVDP